ncbi:MAG: hypothetical protein JWM57_1472 [Phycisphaerales bacterium]|nr:hypothetical protein [Phycisphaerales bacterium]
MIFPSSAEISAAFKLYLPVVKAACEASGVRCRINYPKTTKAKPISAGVTGKLDAFVRAANTTVLHPYDWERFLRFVRYCHAHNVSLGQARLYDELTKREISSKMAKRLAQIYSHGRAVLSCRFEWIE